MGYRKTERKRERERERNKVRGAEERENNKGKEWGNERGRLIKNERNGEGGCQLQMKDKGDGDEDGGRTKRTE